MAFQNKFHLPLSDVTLNEAHQIVIVASELDASTERIINYLNEQHGVGINAVFFSAFSDGDHRYLSRAWMIDPQEAQQLSQNRGAKQAWNGEFYVSFGQDQRRSWEDARRYGFISAGGGCWYSNTLNMLSEGDRVWVNIPKTGYVGVGIVSGERCRIHDFTVDGKTLAELDTVIDYDLFLHEPEDDAEYAVPVKWLYTTELAKAFSETGLFGNQNSVCKPTAAKWAHTIQRLYSVWPMREK